MLSIIIPSRNEPYLDKTIESLLTNAKGDIEIIVILDGYWVKKTIQDKRVRYIHRGEARGMRNGINSAVSISRGDYIMKIDAHCMVDEGFDKKMIDECGENTVIVPRRHRLNVLEWKIDNGGRPPVDYEKFDENLRGEKWERPERNDILIDETPTFQGSCWMMKRSYFDFLELMDEESYGSFFNEAQEICLKSWLSGGKVLVNKKTWYAHWHKDKRGYSMPESEKQKARAFMQKWKDIAWHKQTKKLDWLTDKFNA